MNLLIRLAKKSDLPKYTELLQETYENSYVDDKLGLTKDCFSKEVFNTKDTQRYLLSNLLISRQQKCWLAFDKHVLIGSVSIIEREKDYELRGFYVLPKYQGKGVGKKLWQLVLKFVKDKDITCDIYAHNEKTIELYKKWGFVLDTDRKEFYRHWNEWPEGVRAKSIYMRYSFS